MGLFDDMQDPDLLRSQMGGKCSVCQLLTELTEIEVERLLDLLNDKTVAKAAVSRILNRNGHKIAVNTLSRHVRGECLGVIR